MKSYLYSTPVLTADSTHNGSWRLGTLMGAIALLTSIVSIDAHALALGRITVQSAIGEVLRAEIDITEISASEAATLDATIASPQAFRAAGVEFTPVLSGVQISMQRRADGRSFLRLTGIRPVTEPFVDLILEANWSSGRVARDYTMLFDPPGMRSNTASTQPLPTAPLIARPAAVPLPQLVEITRSPPVVMSTPRPAATGSAQPPAPVKPAVVVKSPTALTARATSPAGGNKKIIVRAGETAGRIASQNKTPSVSLDQMLVALLRDNPDAFLGGNVNRIKTGAVLVIPTPGEVVAVPAAEATQIISAQSVDFNAFRRKLAAGIPTTTVSSADRQASGKVEAKVEDRAPANAIPDKLTLSKGSVAGKPSTSIEEKIIAERQARDSSSRVAELAKNISDLNKLGVASGADSTAATKTTPAIKLQTPPGVTTPGASAPVAAGSRPTASASAPAVVNQASSPTIPNNLAASAAKMATVPAVSQMTAASAPMGPASSVASSNTAASVTTAAASSAELSIAPSLVAASSAASSTALNTPVAPASSAASSPVPVVSASAVAPATTAVSTPSAVATPVKPVPVAPPPESEITDELFSNPFLLPGIALLIALLGGLAFYRYRQRRGPAQVDSSFLESRLQPDSFFGASGGQRVDTDESSVTGSSLVYSPSQLDAAGDVDPVAEADVYLAYGRDLQAEEILKEAMRTSPLRVAIHTKLMEIYAKRRDVKAFAMIATDAFKLTRGEGPEWTYISKMGREMDPANTMYQPGGQPLSKLGTNSADTAAAVLDSSGGFGSSTLPQATEPQFAVPSDSVDFDLDLDFSMDKPVPPKLAPVPAEPAYATPEVFKVAASAPMLDELVMDFGDSTPSSTTPASTIPQTSAKETPPSFEGINFTIEEFRAEPLAETARAKTATRNNDPVQFDMGDLSLDLDGPVTESAPYSAHAPLEDSLETKFALAEEFRSLGDPDGARVLAEEVLLEATGPLKVKTQAFLNALT